MRSDLSGKTHSLGFLRTKEQKEVDFALYDEENNLTDIVEAKVSDSTASRSLELFSERYHTKGSQVVYNLKTERVSQGGVHIRNAEKYLENLEQI